MATAVAVARPPLGSEAMTLNPPLAPMRLEPPAPSRPGPAPAPAPAGAAPTPPLMRDDVIVLVLAAMRPDALWWGWSRIVSRDRPLRHLKGLRFAKALGSGFEGGFGVRPSKDRQGLFLVFDGQAAADDFLADSPTLQGYADHARELFVTQLRATSARGLWSGQPLGVSAVAPPDGVIAALTRASIRPGKALQFWPLAPPAQVALEAAPGCRLAVGLGEAPLLRQATFSIWDNAAAMEAYARSGAHGLAARTSYRDGFFSETMFARFVPLMMRGVWKGVRHG